MAGLEKLIAQKEVYPEETIVVINAASGIKYQVYSLKLLKIVYGLLINNR